MSRFTQLSELERAFAAGEVSAEVVQKRAAQLMGAFRKDRPTWARCVILWNAARSAVECLQKRSTKRRKPYRAH